METTQMSMINDKKIVISLDCMGGDFGPKETVRGAALAIESYEGPSNLEIVLVGKTSEITQYMDTVNKKGLTIVQANEQINDDEHPIEAMRKKRDSSIVVATSLVKSGKCDAMVSMGSTGASMAASVMILGLLDGLERPCIGGTFLGLAPNTVLMDMGSNIDCRPNLLLSFGLIGSVFAEKFLNIKNAKIGLLSVGSEPAKGNKQVQESYKIFQQSGLNFVGNVEGMDFFTGKADVIVCDGFVGNILLKFAEGMGTVLRTFLNKNLALTLPDHDIDELVGELWTETNLARSMGGPLFGVKSPVVLGHGSCVAHEIAGAIVSAVKLVETDMVAGLEIALSSIFVHSNDELK
jgi:glycerol-3-phosphate acyltransferase PlsX